jgi:PAS domain-containing protein
MEMSEGTLIVDQCGDIRYCSTSLARLFGQRPMDLAGRPVWSLLSGWTPYSEPPGSGQASLRTADGSRLPVQIACEILHVADGRLFVIEIRPQAPIQPPDAALSDLHQMHAPRAG